MIQKPKCENYDVTTIRTSSDLHLHWKDHFHRNLLYFRLIADFEDDIDIDNSSIGNKTANFHKQNPVLNGYHIEPDLIEVSKCDYFESPQEYKNVDWFDSEVVKKEN